MKAHLTFLFATGMLISQAQDSLKLEVDNPAPRRGDEVELSLSLEFIDAAVNAQLNEGFEPETNNYQSAEDFTKTILVKDTGMLTLGPFTFNFDGKLYESNVLRLRVEEKLPREEGVFVRSIRYEGKVYIVVEQLADTRDTENLITLVEAPQEGLKLQFRSSSTTSSSVPDDLKMLMKGSFSDLTYRHLKYEVQSTGEVSMVVFEKSDFINWPDNIPFEPIKVNLKPTGQ